MQSLEKIINKADGYHAENRFFSTDENLKKSSHLFILIFIPS